MKTQWSKTLKSTETHSNDYSR